MAELVIKINGDIANYKRALEDAKEQTEKLQGSLEKVATASGIVFAALVAEIGFSVKAYAGQEEAVNKLSAALAHQGIYSKELIDDYREQAGAMQDLSGADDDAIIKGMAVAQGFLGTTKITKEATKAIVDFAAAQEMDLGSAFTMVAKTVGTHTNALARSGIVVNEYATKQEKLSTIVSQLQNKFGGQAEAAAQGLGVYKLLGASIEDLQKKIGERFAPAVTAAGGALLNMVKAISDNKPLMDFIASMIAAGAVVAGLTLAISTAGVAFLALSAALTAAGISATASGIAIKSLIGASGIGLLVVVVSEIALNWSTVWPQMQAIFQGFVEAITEMGQGLGNILKGVFTMDTNLIKEGFEQAKSSFSAGFEEYSQVVSAKKEEVHQKELEDERRRKQELEAQNQVHKEVVLSQEQKVAAELARLREADAKDKISKQAKLNLDYEKNEKIFGTTIAGLAKWLNTEKVQKFKEGNDELAAMQSSSNSTLKAIGKAAAISDIAMRTPVAAMRVYEGFSTIPIVGQALGIAGAAAAVAFGVEQMGKVMAAADGGLITGGVPGKDSVNALLMPGELVVPTQNFEEVVSAVAQNRDGGTSGSGGRVEVVLRLKDDLMNFIESSIVERRNLNLSVLGA